MKTKEMEQSPYCYPLSIWSYQKFHEAMSGNYEGSEVLVFISHSICFIIVDDWTYFYFWSLQPVIWDGSIF